MTSNPSASKRAVIRSTAGWVLPNDETPINRGAFSVGRRSLAFAIAAVACAAFAIAARVIRLIEISPMVGNIAMSLSATYHCTAAVAATGVTIVFGNDSGNARMIAQA